MSIKEDVEDLKGQIRKSIESNDRQQMALLLKQAFALYEKVKLSLQEGTDEQERLKNAEIMKEFREFLAAESKKLSKRAGVSEEEMLRYNENPENFTKEQWIAMQRMKKAFSSKTKEIRQVIKQKNIEAKPANKFQKEEMAEAVLKSTLEKFKLKPGVKIEPAWRLPPKKKTLPKRIKKDKWLKS